MRCKSCPTSWSRILYVIFSYKIREHALQKLPYILVAGDKEKAAGAVAVRARGNKDLGVMSLDAFVELIARDIASKA